MKCSSVILNEDRNVTLTIYLHDQCQETSHCNSRPGILVIPGGGYEFCSDREADPVALSYLKAGYHAFVLRYSVKENAAWPNPLEDYEQAMEYIRNHASDWGIIPNKIAVIGFSAGGHLAACAATMSKNRPNAAILCYALTGSDVFAYNPTAPNAVDAVDRNTCPCFVIATRNDIVVPVSNSVQFIQALTVHDVAFESHIYAFGPHGFSTCDTSIQNMDDSICGRTANWVSDSILWLRDIFGEFSEHGLTTPKCPMRINGDGELFLSVECSLGYLLNHKGASSIMRSVRDQFGTAQQWELALTPGTFAYRMKLKDALEFYHAPQHIIENYQKYLSVIPNKEG